MIQMINFPCLLPMYRLNSASSFMELPDWKQNSPGGIIEHIICNGAPMTRFCKAFLVENALLANWRSFLMLHFCMQNNIVNNELDTLGLNA